MHQFNEHHTEFKGFSKFYDETIAPALRDLEFSKPYSFGLRQFYDAINEHGWQLIIALISMVIFISFFFGTDALVLFLLLPLFLIAFALLEASLSDPFPDQEMLVLKHLATFLGLEFSTTDKPPLSLWRALHLVWLDAYKEDYRFVMKGKRHGVDIEFMSLQQFCDERYNIKYPHNTRLIFDGHLIRFKIQKPFSGQILVLRDGGLGQAKRIGDLKRVGLVDLVFERQFEAYSSDQVEARALLSPDIIQELVDLERATYGRRVEFGFLAQQMFISLRVLLQEDYEFIKLPFSHPERTQRVLDEIGGLLDVIDAVIKRRG